MARTLNLIAVAVSIRVLRVLIALRASVRTLSRVSDRPGQHQSKRQCGERARR